MRNWLERVPEGARVLAIRLRSLGDCVLTTPALHLLKAFRPDLRIGVVVEDAFAAVFQGNPDVEQILPPSLASVTRWHPELCLNLHGGTRSTRLTVASRASLRAGFAHFRFPGIYSVHIPRAQEILHVDRTVHTAEHVASAVFYLCGVEDPPEIPRARLFAQPLAAKPLRPYAVFHPWASQPDKKWPAENFAELARRLEREMDVEAVFIAGSREDLDEFADFRCIRGAGLEDVKTLLANASLFVGNDSGPAHMAAAFGLPVLVFFGSSDPVIWAPWKTESAVLTSSDITSIGVDRAFEALHGLGAVNA
jgi:ADP-heptose:LPS heptosyltransferase